MGFLVDPQRFNVAITRSYLALLIVVGNLHILGQGLQGAVESPQAATLWAL